MKGYVSIYRKDSNVSYDESRFLRLLNQYYKRDFRLKSYHSGQILSFLFTNEPSYDLMKINNDKNFIVGYSGYILKSDQELYHDLFHNQSSSYITSLGGVFSLSCVDLSKDEIKVWNNITGVEPVYWAETKNAIVVGTKAILVHLLASGTDQPIYEPKNLVSFLNNGYFIGYDTPFKQTYVLENNSTIVIKDNKLVISEIDDLKSHLYSLEPDPKFMDEITDIFIDSFSGLKGLTGELKAELTGGKDSRLIVSGLQSIGVDYSARTSGFQDSPDVLVAKEIAGVLGIEHEVDVPVLKDAQTMEITIADRVQDVIANSEGLLYAYENITIPPTFNTERVTLGGQGGELVRGGFGRNRNRNIAKKQQLENFFKSSYANYNDWIKPELAKSFEDSLQDYIRSQPSHIQPVDSLNRIYLDFRTGRWSGASRPVYSTGFFFYTPFFDSKLVRKVQLLKTKFASSERLNYEIIKRTAPELLDIPFANDRWAFEKENPEHYHDLAGWIKKKPVVPESSVSGFNWRVNILENLSEEFYEGIFQDENSAIFDIVAKEKVKQLFETKQNNPRRFDKFLWALFSANVLLSNKWLDHSWKGKESTIEIPKQEKITNSNILREIRLLPTDQLYAKAWKLKVKSNVKTSANIKAGISNFNKPYLQLFKGSFDQIPEKKYRQVATIGAFTNFDLIFEVTQDPHQELDFLCFVMFYDDKERIHTEKEDIKITKQSQFVRLKMEKPNGAKYFRLAIKLNPNQLPTAFGINQIRLEGYN